MPKLVQRKIEKKKRGRPKKVKDAPVETPVVTIMAARTVKKRGRRPRPPVPAPMAPSNPMTGGKWQMLGIYAGLDEFGTVLRLLMNRISDAPEFKVVRDFLQQMSGLPGEQRSVLLKEFGWAINPASQIVEAVDEISSIK